MGKRYKRLYEQVYDFENLWLASRKARKGKRLKSEVIDFEYDLEKELFKIRDELSCGAYQFSPYRTFTVTEPALRLISAAPYRDRVVHHAICNIIEPLLDKAMIYDSYACRMGKGMHRALDRAQLFLRNNEWILKIDIKKYFFTINHRILLSDLGKKINDDKLFKLLRQLLNTYVSGPEYDMPFQGDLPLDRYLPKGLPIGNLTSQLFANYFLTPLDRFIKEKLKVKHYLRYMDDLLIFSNDQAKIKSMKHEIGQFLDNRRLKMHPDKTQIFPRSNGIRYLGFHIYEHYRRILKPNLNRFKIRFAERIRKYENKHLAFEHLLLSLNAWLGFAGKNKNQSIINIILSEMMVAHPNKDYQFQFYLP